MKIRDLIRSVREELVAADSERLAADEPALLELEKIEMEVSLTVTETSGSKGGFDLKVVTVGGEASTSELETHRVNVVYRLDEGARSSGATGTRSHASNASAIKRDVRPIN